MLIPKKLFGVDISKSLLQAKKVEVFAKQFQPKPQKYSQGSKYPNTETMPKILFCTRTLTISKARVTEVGDK